MEYKNNKQSNHHNKKISKSNKNQSISLESKQSQQYNHTSSPSYQTVSTNTQIQDLLEEIQELELEILDMFEVIFHFINLKKERLQDALQYYMQILESQNENTPYNAQHIIEIIKIIQTQKPEWFSNQ